VGIAGRLSGGHEQMLSGGHEQMLSGGHEQMLSGGHEQIPLLNSSAVILQNPIVIRQWKAATNHERLRTTGQIQQSREFKTVFCC